MTRGSERFTFVAAALACLLLAPVAAFAGEERLIERTVPAAKVRELAVKGHVGKIEVSSASGDNVILRLRLKPKEYDGWLFSRRKGDPERAELRHETRGVRANTSVCASPTSAGRWGRGARRACLRRTRTRSGCCPPNRFPAADRWKARTNTA